MDLSALSRLGVEPQDGITAVVNMVAYEKSVFFKVVTMGGVTDTVNFRLSCKDPLLGPDEAKVLARMEATTVAKWLIDFAMRTSTVNTFLWCLNQTTYDAHHEWFITRSDVHEPTTSDAHHEWFTTSSDVIGGPWGQHIILLSAHWFAAWIPTSMGSALQCGVGVGEGGLELLYRSCCIAAVKMLHECALCALSACKHLVKKQSLTCF